MLTNIQFYLDQIAFAADLSRALPGEALKRLQDLEREIANCERRRLAEAQEADRAAQASWANLSARLSGVGVRPDPYRPRQMPTPDARSQPFLQFARRMAWVRQTMKPLAFHLLIPLEPGVEAQARAIGPDLGSILDRRVDNVRALQDAAASADTFIQLSTDVPSRWENPSTIQRELSLEAIGALELAGRAAAFLDQNKKAADFRMRAATLCRELQLVERCDSNIIARVWAGVAADEPAGDMLAILDFPFGRPVLWDPTKTDVLSLIGTPSRKPIPSILAGLTFPVLQAYDYGPATTLVGAEARVVRARLHQALNEDQEAIRLLEEAKAVVEPKGQVECPDRNAFATIMLKAMTLQTEGNSYLAEIQHLTELTRKRALAMSYCETAGLAYADINRQKSDRYKRTAIQIASM
ncbi:hypothetical protein [uncultured Bradyrhizobium sp.]|jgi:hypothetical protein|uniref:hypothetical protein n=1 Tax=uncultured Bradyrhizobium sp. TaxID=199684 RepID=UPI0026028B7F|nr:hypothetical protein [uncultured Bradyrhizobium sp.]